MRTTILLSFFSLFVHYSNAQLVINEISQGSGSQEWVEFIVMGERACIAPLETWDLRGIVIDDNNGYFNSGTGTGIAAGAVQFALIPFWSAIPTGTTIVIYNNTDVNPALPPMDVSMNDGNCRLIIPINSTLFNGQNSLPNTTNSSYPPQASWINGGGNWSQISMNNSNDSFQIRASITSTTPSYSVSWGNNNALGTAQVYDLFAGSELFTNTMSVNYDPLTASNWYATSGSGTPGTFTTTQNHTYLLSRNPECYGGSLPVFTFNITPTSCGDCNGAINTTVVGGSPYYYYDWSDGQIQGNIIDLCPGTISVNITDDYGCQLYFDTIIPQGSTLIPQVQVTDESCPNACNGSAIASTTGGIAPYNYSWSNGFVGSNIEDLCAGTYSLTITDQNNCAIATNVTINSGTSSIVPQASVTDETCSGACNGSALASATGGAAPYSYSWSNSFNGPNNVNLCAGAYMLTVTDQNNCASTTNVTINSGASTLTPQALVANETCGGECDGSAIASANGGTAPYSYSWSNGITGSQNQDLCPGTYTLTASDQNGCSGTLTITINAGLPTPSSAFNDPGTHFINDAVVLIPTPTGGGTWSSSCGNCISTAGVFDPSISGEGVFEVCYTNANGNCSSTSCDSITITAPCHDVEISLHGQLCVGDTFSVNGIDYTEVGIYTQVFPLPFGCDSTVNFILTECLDGSMEIEIPNVITPNGDNVNDIWFVDLTNLQLKEGFIVNRWGETIRTFVDNSIQWDGSSDQGGSATVVDGVYFYRLTFYSEAVGEFTKQGIIQVFR